MGGENENRTVNGAGAEGGEKEQRMWEAMIARGRSDLLACMRFCWWRPDSLVVGRHTRAFADRLTKAVFDWRQGKSTYLIVAMPHRHGKSDMVAIALPSWFLGVCCDRHPDVIITGYGEDIAKKSVPKCKEIIKSARYKLLFPGVELDPNRDKATEWGIRGSAGTVIATGLGGKLTGNGAHLGVVDDYCKSPEEANSPAFRDSCWNEFTAAFLTRQNAPANIIIICATRWHPDDLVGRVKKNTRENPDFPQFEEMVFPASKPGEYDLLFPEYMGADWYTKQRATLGPTFAAAMLDCNPVSAGTRMFRDEWWQVYEKQPDASKLNIYFFIDGAKKKGQANDFTDIKAVGFGEDNNYYLLDMVHERLSLSERTQRLFAMHRRWRPLGVYYEQTGAQCDVEHIKEIQNRDNYRFPVTELPQRINKELRIGWLEPLWSTGRIWVPRTLMKTGADGNTYDAIAALRSEFDTYPASVHDDALDNLANIQHPLFISQARWPSPRDWKESKHEGEEGIRRYR